MKGDVFVAIFQRGQNSIHRFRVSGLAEVSIVHGDNEIALLHPPIGSHGPLGRNALGVYCGPFTAGRILEIIRGNSKTQGPPSLVSKEIAVK